MKFSEMNVVILCFNFITTKKTFESYRIWQIMAVLVNGYNISKVIQHSFISENFNVIHKVKVFEHC